ncbi:EamA family transporter [Pseudomonas sp. 18175]|uniref:EamA family transporter n=1 Tax=Pseudomonas sp. 18175 TaxID=3390056 RepID=UPI003D1A114E
MNARKNFQPYTLPVILSVLAQFFLGASSLYWRALSEVPPTTLVAYRIILSTAIITLFILICRHPLHKLLLKSKSLTLHCTASFFLVINWCTFIWSSINGHILESGLGYLLAPFISVILGFSIYREKVKKIETISICISLSIITLLMLSTEHLNHFTYLLITASWGAYTYIKKASPLDAKSGTLIESLCLAICLTLAIWLFDLKLLQPDQLTSPSTRLIWLAGIVSVSPLIMFSYATGKIPLSLTGLLQFALPITLIIISLTTLSKQPSNTTLTLLLISAALPVLLTAYDVLFNRKSQQ